MSIRLHHGTYATYAFLQRTGGCSAHAPPAQAHCCPDTAVVSRAGQQSRRRRRRQRDRHAGKHGRENEPGFTKSTMTLGLEKVWSTAREGATQSIVLDECLPPAAAHDAGLARALAPCLFFVPGARVRVPREIRVSVRRRPAPGRAGGPACAAAPRAAPRPAAAVLQQRRRQQSWACHVVGRRRCGVVAVRLLGARSLSHWWCRHSPLTRRPSSCCLLPTMPSSRLQQQKQNSVVLIDQHRSRRSPGEARSLCSYPPISTTTRVAEARGIMPAIRSSTIPPCSQRAPPRRRPPAPPPPPSASSPRVPAPAASRSTTAAPAGPGAGGSPPRRTP